MPRHRTLVIWTLVALVLVACGGSSGGSAAKSPYVVYFSSDETAGTASIGQGLLSAITGYIDYTNKQGGVKGHQIKLVALDDAMDISHVKVNIQQASAANALAIVGANNSNAWSANATLIQQDQIPTIGLGFTDAQLATNNQYLYGLSPAYSDYVKLQVALINDVLIKGGTVPAKPRVAFYHYASTAISTMIAYQHTALTTQGWTFATDQSFAVAPTDVSSQASAVAASKPDVVIAEVLDSHAPLVLNALRQKGYTGPIVNFSAANAPATYAGLKDPTYYGQNHYLNATWTDQPGVAEVQRRAKAVNDTSLMDNGFYPFGWAAAAALVAGLNKCPDPCTSGAMLNTALGNVGKVDVNGLNPNAFYTATDHHLAHAGIYFHWDAAKNAPEPVGTWTQLTGA
jgi:branched-chain amino acid transport system substrate-binding protein